MERWLDDFAKLSFEHSSAIAHDLKTPLNIAVLNLELLRMRVRKLLETADDDEKLDQYSRSVELELRRLARIFDAYFTYSVPPKGLPPPEPVKLEPLVRAAAEKCLFGESVVISEAIEAMGHETRLRDLFRFFFEGVSRLFEPGSSSLVFESGDGALTLTCSGTARAGLEVGKVFKFYYTDESGQCELSLATANLIANTYAGSLDLREEEGSTEVELRLPLRGR